MPHVDRPPKAGNTRQFQTEVAAGFIDILANEVDGDLDTIYALCNGNLADDNIAPNAHIAYSKLSLAGSIKASDLAAGFTAPAGSVPASAIVPGSITGTQLAPNCITTDKIADGTILRADIAPAQLHQAPATGNLATNFTTTVIGSYVDVPGSALIIVTRGATPVFLWTTHEMAGVALGGPGQVVIRWLRNPGAVQVCNASFALNGPGVFPVPQLAWVDVVPAAGTYGYVLQVFLGNGMVNVSTLLGGTGGQVRCMEVG